MAGPPNTDLNNRLVTPELFGFKYLCEAGSVFGFGAYQLLALAQGPAQPRQQGIVIPFPSILTQFLPEQFSSQPVKWNDP